MRSSSLILILSCPIISGELLFESQRF